MPRLSDSMEEGTILEWLKASGDQVQVGEDLVEIETDKATTVYAADASGTLEIIAGEGRAAAVGELIATIGSAGGADLELTSETVAAQPSVAAQQLPATAEQLSASDPGITDPSGGQPQPARGGAVKATPTARRAAKALGIDLTSVVGTAQGGRITKEDVQAAAAAASSAGPSPATATASEVATANAAPTGPSPAVASTDGATTQPAPAVATETPADLQALSRVQKIVAQRMSESRATVPDFTLERTIDMEAAVLLREALKTPAGPTAAPLPSYNDMLVRACALALRAFPRANGSYTEAGFELHEHVNVGIAVATDDALLVPTIFDADHRSLTEIARETRRLAESVRSKTVAPTELEGGTFTVSNLGMFGIERFTAIVNAPQAAILAVGQLAPRASVIDGVVSARHAMTVSLSCDHRILYGADAALFLARIAELLEHPLGLLA